MAGASHARSSSAALGIHRLETGRPRRHSGILASIVIPFSARLGKLKCRNSWGNIGFLAKKNILLRHYNDGSDIMKYFQFIIEFEKVLLNDCNCGSARHLRGRNDVLLSFDAPKLWTRFFTNKGIVLKNCTQLYQNYWPNYNFWRARRTSLFRVIL